MMSAENSEQVSVTHEELQADEKLVPVSEAIRYRKRAQSAEKELEDAKREVQRLQKDSLKLESALDETQKERELMRKLSSVGAVDLEAAVLIAKERLASGEAEDVDACIERLCVEKQYLFSQGRESGEAIRKTSGVREKTQSSGMLERTAKRAMQSGSRADLQEYLKARRNYR